MRLALGAAAGFLAGVLLVIALGGSGGRTATVTVSGPLTSGGTVVVRTTVPELVGQPLDVSRKRVERARFKLAVDHGGGVFGVVVESNWQVSRQEPAPGTQLEQGSTVHVDIRRG